MPDNENDAPMADDALTANVTLSATQLQQSFYENMPDYDWLRYDRDQASYLKQNIAYPLFGPPKIEGNLQGDNDSTDDLQGYTSREKERVLKIFNQISEQGKYCRQGDIFMTCIQVVYVTPNESYYIEPNDYWDNLENSRDVMISCTPVFKIRKCVASSNTQEIPACKIFVDEDARVYQSWDSYIQNNTLPRSILVVPTNGEYTGIIEEEAVVVSLSVLGSPNLSTGASVLRATDTGVTAIAVVGVGAIITAAALPAVAVAGAVAATASTVAGVYGIVRSSLHLADRTAHDQSINPIREPEARGSWLNVVVSSVGLSASASCAMLARSAASGNNLTQVGRILTIATDVLGGATLVTGLGGIVNGLYTMVEKYINHDESPTRLELFQFSTSLLFFAGTAMSNKTAQSIIEESQTNAINDYRTTLRSNRHRNIFDKVSAETRRVGGHIEGNTEVIRAIRTIDNKDQFWANMIKINKDIKPHGVRVSLNSEGSINLNAQHSFNAGTLSRMESSQSSNLFTTIGRADTSVPNVSTKLNLTDTSNNKIDILIIFKGDSILSNIQPNDYLRLGNLVITMSQTSFENIERLLSDLSAAAYSALMALCSRLIEQLSNSEVEIVRLLFGNQFILEKIVEFVYGYINDMAQQYAHDVSKPFLLALNEFFVDGKMKETTLRMLKDLFISWVKGEFKSLREDNACKIICKVCAGFRYA